MEVAIALSPELDLDAPELAATWNEDVEARALAEASVGEQEAQDYIDPALIRQGLVLLGGFAGGLALDAVKDVVQAKLTAFLEKKLSKKPSIQVDAVRQPGGAYLLVVTEQT
jgi:hypothetical protein